MKILVSNFGRQYVNDLLLVVEQNGWLAAFYTAFAANKLPFQRFLPFAWRQSLRKRAFAGIHKDKIRHFPGLFALERFFRDRFAGRISRMTGDWFDRKVAQDLASSKPDIVIAYENTNRKTMRIAQKMGTVTVLDLAQIHHEDITIYGRWFMTSEQWQDEVENVNPRKTEALQYTDYVLALSGFAAESMLRHGWPADRLYTVSLGIDPQQFTPKRRYPSDGPLRLLFVGTITRRKGLGILFEVLRSMEPGKMELTLIGPLADAADLLQENQGNFRYLPFLHHEELVRHYQQADVFVFPSLLDSWAQTVLESMACGTPAIVTENTGAKDAVGQGGGWIIPVNDMAALRSCLLECAADRGNVEGKGRKAAAIAQNYTRTQYREQLTSAIKDIARREHIPFNNV